MAKQYSVSHFSTHAESIILQVQSTKEPVCISMGGAAAAVVVDAEMYVNMSLALKEYDRIFREGAQVRPAWVDEQVRE